MANPTGPNAAKISHHGDRSLDRTTKKHARSHKIAATAIDPIHAAILTVLSKW
jgi:hypothetical protein